MSMGLDLQDAATTQKLGPIQVPIEEQVKVLQDKLYALEKYLNIRVSSGTHYVKREETW